MKAAIQFGKKSDRTGNVWDDYFCCEDFVVVKRRAQDLDEMTEGGVVKPQIAQEKPQWVTVVAISYEEKELQVGDEIFISRYPPGEDEPFAGEKVLVIHKTLIRIYPKRTIQ